jgi:hypothetical protein
MVSDNLTIGPHLLCPWFYSVCLNSASDLSNLLCAALKFCYGFTVTSESLKQTQSLEWQLQTNCQFFYILFWDAQPNSLLRSLYHTQNINALSMAPLDEQSARRIRTQQTQKTIIHAYNGIRTLDLSNQEAANLCHIPHGCCHRPFLNTLPHNYSFHLLTDDLSFIFKIFFDSLLCYLVPLRGQYMESMGCMVSSVAAKR